MTTRKDFLDDQIRVLRFTESLVKRKLRPLQIAVGLPDILQLPSRAYRQRGVRWYGVCGNIGRSFLCSILLH